MKLLTPSFTRGMLLALAAALVVACAEAPPATSGAHGSRVPPNAGAATLPASTADGTLGPEGIHGKVLGRGERFVIYQPGAGDTLKLLAGHFLGDQDRDWLIADFNDIDRVIPGDPVVVPLATMNAVGVQTGQLQTVPILCYHRFGTGGGKLSVTPANFALQLDWLARNGFHVISMARLVAFLDGRERLPRQSVVITIDDGYESAYRLALPLLRQHGFPATLFVYTDFIGSSDALSWKQLLALVNSGLIEIGAHSKSHRNLVERASGQTDRQYLKDIEAEIKRPREVLESRLPIKVRYFAFPFGDANATVLDALSRDRYEVALTVNPGGNPFFSDRMLLRRTMIFGDHDLAAFKSKLQVGRASAAP